MITVLGATGNTGRRITRRLCDEGASVRAVGRDADRLAAALGPADGRLEHGARLDGHGSSARRG